MPVQDNLPKSRVTLVYETEIQGTPKAVVIPFRMLVLGDFSLGKSKDAQQDLSERKLRSLNGKNFEEVMKEMEIKVPLKVENKIDKSSEELQIQIDIEDMESFSPHQLMTQIEKVKGLSVLKSLLIQAQASYNNSKEIRNEINKTYQNPTALKSVTTKITELLKKDARTKGNPMRLPWSLTTTDNGNTPPPDNNTPPDNDNNPPTPPPDPNPGS